MLAPVTMTIEREDGSTHSYSLGVIDTDSLYQWYLGYEIDGSTPTHLLVNIDGVEWKLHEFVDSLDEDAVLKFERTLPDGSIEDWCFHHTIWLRRMK